MNRQTDPQLFYLLCLDNLHIVLATEVNKTRNLNSKGSFFLLLYKDYFIDTLRMGSQLCQESIYTFTHMPGRIMQYVETYIM